MKIPTRGDWVTVLDDIEVLGIRVELEDIKKMAQNKFKPLVKKQTEESAFKYLLQKKKKYSEHSTVKNPIYKELSMANYLSPSDGDISLKKKKWLHKCRSEEFNINLKIKPVYGRH